MLSTRSGYGIVISRLPVIQSGLCAIMRDNFPEYESGCYQYIEELTLMQLRRATLVLVDLFGGSPEPHAICEQYYSLMTQYTDIRWVFLVSPALYPLAVEYLMRPQSSLLSDAEPVAEVIRVIREKSDGYISSSLVVPRSSAIEPGYFRSVSLTISERQVLRLLAKGWGINQIATMLHKSNKTVSAQKNSAIRRLSLRGNADMYAWINSAEGMRELNLHTVYGEHAEWKNMPQRDISLS
ncbi:helix-turn-helix transcriptional regulator [[Enterobacter] lignolyticus]|uniref:Transcriptional regulator n=1 Tax=[Enterobacter] lignolyticus TaxID=1334193 RepID=A0A806X6Z7_9ENTR|nr:LuxR C-terminal-related transcriptional regulator [[Enterobacter] lignolyticus]ALR75323.1 transcriptional regulator [[Enterobacter] lignolyticus]